MNASMNTNDVDTRWMLVSVGAHEFAIDIAPVREVRGFTEPVFLPQAPHYVRGLLDLRGAVIPLVDIADQLGLPPITTTESSVVVVVEHAGKVTGLLVDQVLDLLAVPLEFQQPVGGADRLRRCIAGSAILNEHILHLIALDNLLAWREDEPAPAFDSVQESVGT